MPAPDRTPGTWIDVSVPLRTSMVHWPGDPAVVIERVMSFDAGDRSTVSRLDMSAHTGTHMDAPLHFVPGGAAIDTMPIDATVGPARVVAIDDPVSVKADVLEALAIDTGERLLFKTRNSARAWASDAFVEDFVFLSAEAARYLARKRLRCVGVDYLSVSGYHEDSAPTHRALLEAGIWIIEGLNLARVEPGRYDLVCLPLRIAGGDGAPARAALRRRDF
jgi:arylformamidase